MCFSLSYKHFEFIDVISKKKDQNIYQNPNKGAVLSDIQNMASMKCDLNEFQTEGQNTPHCSDSEFSWSMLAYLSRSITVEKTHTLT